ncbi:echinoidin [Strongylocentrotus purpuratus]|uniref:C-type lectin domain-containing protein n=1 Tax=Strongylocentrotus purpuratus TaxID=7668 RepID=A0A7M7RCA2_STRPU|nr:echinoidin [Strongylocentrotus purpuratus]|eukprot:XP_787997.1 PREDICTED: echinoidin [Strongylocentrotus purpuratus]
METLARSCVVVATVIFIGAFLQQLPGVAGGGCGCSPLWTAYNGYCYRFFNDRNISWIDAELRCRSFSIPCGDSTSSQTIAHLVSVHSQEEMDFLTAMYESLRPKRGPSRAWIGLHDRASENCSEWIDGTTVNFTDWGTGQPNDRNGFHDCTFFARWGDYKWNDMGCDPDNVESYICKHPKW